MKTCFNCDCSENDVPLVTLTFLEKQLFICPQCLPALIHKPQVLAAKLPGLHTEGVGEPEE